MKTCVAVQLSGLVLFSLAACSDAETGADGASGLARSTAEPAGVNCPFGGTALAFGSDANGDGALGDDEVQVQTYVCSGEPGADGADGADGEPGPEGEAGTNASPALTAVTDEPAGDNCENGGFRIETGLDTDSDSELDPSEVTSTSYACLPESTGGSVFRSSTSFLGGASAACAGGFVRTALGADANANGTLDPDEEQSSFLYCNALPTFQGAPVLNVDSCAADFTFEIGVTDPDGTVGEPTFEVLYSTSPLSISVSATNEITIAAGDYVGGAVIQVTATDNWGSVASRNYFVTFNGDDCDSINGFWGVVPETCVEVEVDPIAGDDRGGVVLTSSYVFYNGDDGLIRLNRDLSDPRVVVTQDIDTLFGDPVTGNLYTLWSSGFADGATLGDVDLADCCDGDGWDQIALLNPETLAVVSTVDMTSPVFRNETTSSVTIGTETFDLQTEDALLAIRDSRLLVAMRGVDETNLRIVILYRVIDVSDGSTVDEWLVDDVTVPLGVLRWSRQETEIQHYSITVVDGVDHLVFNSSDDDFWYLLNLVDRTVSEASQTFAGSCDLQNLTLDANGGVAWYHAEDSCFGAGADEVVGYCLTQAVPNDGSIDDSGN